MPSNDVQLPRICFDDEYRVRVLDLEKFVHTQELESECNQFVSKMEDFHGTVKGVLEIMEAQAKRIELEKLKAIGQRNRVDNEIENRNRQKTMLEVLIKEKQTELERYCQQYISLTKIEDEQQQLIEKLSNNEA
ncbi:Intraflagellar Transport Protein 20 [Achlya hypogyna]|uniref:Intraflagellar Transport Protein 20 n=1 Tax=Achlya hypogyna TaxID=1202772 RepID=A0A1V9YZU9_ACHHY|nr:Intraflagellar Transport Protein 20 [Achlya hypogyna]